MKNKDVIQKVVLGGVLIKNNKVLIVQRNQNEKVFPGLWELPSGKKENLETADQALIREIKEEINLNVDPIFPFNVFNYQIEKKDIINDTTQINFFVKAIDDISKIKLSQEHQKYEWIKLNELKQYDISPATKKVIKKAFKLMSLIKLS